MKTVWITGSASGIGCHLSGEFLRRGWQVIASDRDLDGLQARAAAQNWPMATLMLLALDITVAADWALGLQHALYRFGKVDLLINCAGIMQPGFVLETDPGSLQRQLHVNVCGQIIGAQTVGRQMLAQGHGHIVQIASLAALGPVRGIAFYAASKAAVRSAMLALAMELEDSGVAVSVVCPDLVKTAMFELQLNYPRESAVVFSGARPLTVDDLARALFDIVLPQRPLEICLPAARGWSARLGGCWPALSRYLQRRLARKGEAAIRQARP